MTTTFKYSLEGQETERIIFRKVLESDFETWLAFCKFPDSLKYIFSQDQLLVEDSTERCKMWFERVFSRYQNGLGGMNALIDKHSGELIGQCGLLIQTIDGLEELEIGYSLMPQFRGKGYAAEAARRCKKFAFENDYRESVISVIHVDNAASIQVAKANGMVLDKTTDSKGDRVHVFRVTKLMFENEV